MGTKPGAILAVIIPFAFIFIIFIIAVGECDSDTPNSGNYTQYGTISPDEAVRRLADMSARVDAKDRFVSSGEMVVATGKADLANTLPPVDKINTHFPLTVEPLVTSQDVVIEIFCSTEKSGTKEPDDWFTKIAKEFNDRGVTTSGGKRVQIKLRYIASGTAYMYIASKKYIPDAFSPSNHIWIKMTEASGIVMTPVMERMVGNIAGIVMKDDTYNKLKTNFGEVNLKAVIDAVAQGDIAMGYTDPYASSTGLNFLITVLQTYAGGSEAKMLSPEVMSAFEAFQKNVPYVAFTTIQMRESVQKGGLLDAFVLEYQTFIREPNLQTGYKFIPFGLRHDNPLYGV
ncbi:MAG: VWA domain-containing protein, partial [Spirochaetaceae bacterium]